MRDAYSILLGDAVTASEIDYGMCEEFLVVCPCCSESVIKKERERADGGVTHFLAHRAAQPDQAVECERRVSSMSIDDIRRAGALARGQDLEKFFASFGDMVAGSLDAFTRESGPRARGAKALLAEVRGGMAFQMAIVKMLRYAPIMTSPDYVERIEQWVMNYVSTTRDVATDRPIVVTPRMDAAMRLLLRDILGHIATPQGKDNLKTVLAAGVIRRGGDHHAVGEGLIPELAMQLNAAISLAPAKYERMRRNAVAILRGNAAGLGPFTSEARANPSELLLLNQYNDLLTASLHFVVLSPFSTQLWRQFRRTPDQDRVLAGGEDARVEEALAPGPRP